MPKKPAPVVSAAQRKRDQAFADSLPPPPAPQDAALPDTATPQSDTEPDTEVCDDTESSFAPDSFTSAEEPDRPVAVKKEREQDWGISGPYIALTDSSFPSKVKILALCRTRLKLQVWTEFPVWQDVDKEAQLGQTWLESHKDYVEMYDADFVGVHRLMPEEGNSVSTDPPPMRADTKRCTDITQCSFIHRQPFPGRDEAT